MTSIYIRGDIEKALTAIEKNPSLANFLARGTSLSSSTLSKADFLAELSGPVKKDVIAFTRDLLEREFIPYDPSYQLSTNQALTDELSALPELGRLEDIIRVGDVPLDASSEHPVVAMIHRLEGPEHDSLSVFRLKGTGIATRRARGIRPLVRNEGLYVEITDEIIYYEPRFDVLLCRGHVIVTATTTLQRKLNSPERAQAMARKTFTQVTANITISGADELLEAVTSDPAMIAKMAAISRILDSEPEYAEFLTTERLTAFLAENPHIGVAVEGEGENQKLVFDPAPQNRYRIVKMLADDFLSSRLSGHNYEAGSKHRL